MRCYFACMSELSGVYDTGWLIVVYFGNEWAIWHYRGGPILYMSELSRRYSNMGVVTFRVFRT